MWLCKACGICRHVDLKIVTSVLEFLVGFTFRVQTPKQERYTEKVACCTGNGDWHSETVGGEVCVLGRASTRTEGRLWGTNKC